jgi:hypothetical protein
LIILVCAHDRRIALRRPKTIRACHQFSRFGLAEVIVQPACGARLAKEDNPAQNSQNCKKGIDVDGFSQGRFQIFSRTPLFWIAK